MRQLKKYEFIIALCVIALFVVGCSKQATETDLGKAEPVLSKAATVELSMTAKQWAFEPSTIHVKKGDTVKIFITSVDVNHGFSLPDFGVSKTLEAGKTTEVEFIANKVGTFPFRCNVFCGENHAKMQGEIIVG